MCGISGFVSQSTQPAGVIGKMTDLVRHRGPDDEGFVLFTELSSQALVCGGDDTPGNVYCSGTGYAPEVGIRTHSATPVKMALGHRRLSILDLSSLGHQPMCSHDKRFWIVYNGEIYNYLELRSELEELGYFFSSNSDTEVILSAYAHWGSDCLHRLNGMWAFAILDTKQRKLFLARDRFGIKPLYYWTSPSGEFAFASEIKQFSAFPLWEANLNRQRAYDFLVFGLSDHTDETLFDGVFQLGPGCRLTIDIGDHGFCKDGLMSERWYHLTAAPFSGSFEDACQSFRQKFEHAVSLQLRADVPVGSCLSGGLDSSSIVCVMNRLLHEQKASALQKTFSACAEVSRFDERKWIEIVVGATGVAAHFIYPSLEYLFDESSIIAWHQDEPYGSTSIYAQWNVFGLAAANGVKVMLDGQGSDEQLAGYESFFGPHLSALFYGQRWGAFLQEVMALKRRHQYGYRNAARHLANHTLPEWIKDLLKRACRLTPSSPSWLDSMKLGCKTGNPLFLEGRARARTVGELSYSQLTSSNLQRLLHWEDRDSMAHSIEARVPFLDHRLVEFVFGLPDEYKIYNGVTKRVLRQGMSGILPDSIRDRVDKLGFVTPEEVWLREKAPEMFRKKVREAIEASRGILRKEQTEKMLEEMIIGKRPFSFLPWRIISFGEWVRRFGVIC